MTWARGTLTIIGIFYRISNVQMNRILIQMGTYFVSTCEWCTAWFWQTWKEPFWALDWKHRPRWNYFIPNPWTERLFNIKCLRFETKICKQNKMRLTLVWISRYWYSTHIKNHLSNLLKSQAQPKTLAERAHWVRFGAMNITFWWNVRNKFNYCGDRLMEALSTHFLAPFMFTRFRCSDFFFCEYIDRRPRHSMTIKINFHK